MAPFGVELVFFVAAPHIRLKNPAAPEPLEGVPRGKLGIVPLRVMAFASPMIDDFLLRLRFVFPDATSWMRAFADELEVKDAGEEVIDASSHLPSAVEGPSRSNAPASPMINVASDLLRLAIFCL